MKIKFYDKTSELMSKSFAKNRIYITKISETTYNADDFEFTFYRKFRDIENISIEPDALNSIYWKRNIDLERKIYKRLTRPLMQDFLKWYIEHAPKRKRMNNNLMIHNLIMNGLGIYIYSLFRANNLRLITDRRLTKYYNRIFESMYQMLWIKNSQSYIPNKILFYKYIHRRFKLDMAYYLRFRFHINRNLDAKIKYFIHLYRNFPVLVQRVVPFKELNENYYSKLYFPERVLKKNKIIIKEKKRKQILKNKLHLKNNELFYDPMDCENIDIDNLFAQL